MKLTQSIMDQIVGKKVPLSQLIVYVHYTKQYLFKKAKLSEENAI